LHKNYILLLLSHVGVTSHIDDEYQLAGVDDPRILITTSRNPSARLKQFAKVCLLVVYLAFDAKLMKQRTITLVSNNMFWFTK